MICALSLAMLSGVPPAAQPPNKPMKNKKSGTDPRMVKLYTCWFEDPYPYMFGYAGGVSESRGGESAATVVVNDKMFTEFKAGIDGIMFYGGLARCMRKLTKPPAGPKIKDYRPVVWFSGLELYAGDAKEEQQPFSRYNRELIRWGHENMIPPPDTVIGGARASEIYRKVFALFARLMAEAYLALRDSGQYESDQKKYLKIAHQRQNAWKTRKPDALDWLMERYAEWLPGYPRERDYTSMTVQMAIGFWLRRGIDKTDTELWTGLRKVLLLYDKQWYASLRTRYPNAQIRW